VLYQHLYPTIGLGLELKLPASMSARAEVSAGILSTATAGIGVRR
jgi:hypothetical protein